MNDEEISSNKYLDNDILSKAFINEYNLDICSKLPAIRITARYEPIYSCPVPRQNHQMDSVDRKIDEKAEYQFMNEKLTAMMRIMNSDERKCFTEKFINEKTDYQLAKIMQRSRCGTIPFVNSCIIRIILTFHLEVMADEQFDFDETENIEFDYSDYIVKNN
jgi:hypothetical protein